MILDGALYPQVKTNSTTYADLAGIPLGLDRLTGEPSDVYRNRLQAAAQLDRSAQYQGLLNEIGLQLGLLPEISLSLTDTTGAFTAVTSIAGLQLQNSVETLEIPFLTYDPDDFWNWRPIADIAADVNTSASFTAAVLKDGLAYKIARQSNLFYQSGEAVAGQTVKLQHAGILSGSEVFSAVVPAYVFSSDGQTLHFASPVPDGVTIASSYQTCPWNVVTSPVALVSLLDPDLPAVALAPTGNLAYQMREYLQELVARDRSYWAR